MSGIMLVSIICGGIFASMLFVVLLIMNQDLAFPMAILGGAVMTLALHIIFSVLEKRRQKKYAKLEKEIKSPIFYQTEGVFHLGNKVKNGNIYFCEEGIVLASLDEKPYACDEILISNIEKYEFGKAQMSIYTKDGRAFLISMPNAEIVLNELKSKNWIQ